MKDFFGKVMGFILPLSRVIDNNNPFSARRLFFVIFSAIPFTFFVRWILTFIGDAGSYFFVMLIILAAFVHKKEDGIAFARRVLHYLLVIGYGFGSLWSFVGHFILADQVAASIGWLTSPFQTELAFVHLGFGIVGIMAIWIQDNLWTSIIVSRSVFLLGAAYVHIQDSISHSNFSPGNTGAVLVLDIVLPVLFFSLMWYVRESFEGNKKRA